MRQTRTVSLDTLEYLYVPDVAYATYGETQREMQLISRSRRSAPKLLYPLLAYCRARWARPSSSSFSHSCFFPQAGDFASAEASRGQ